MPLSYLIQVIGIDKYLLYNTLVIILKKFSSTRDSLPILPTIALRCRHRADVMYQHCGFGDRQTEEKHPIQPAQCDATRRSQSPTAKNIEFCN